MRHDAAILRKRPAKRPTLADVAQSAGVSRSAAARVLLGTGGDHVRVAAETRERIESAAKRLRYSPNRSAQLLRGVSSRTIGVILDTLNLPVMSERVFALEAEASRRGWRLLIGHAHGQAERIAEYVEDFTGRASDVIIALFDLTPSRDARARQCFGTWKNVIFHGRPAWPGGYSVRVDTEHAVAQSVDHLVRNGRKRLALALWNRAGDEFMTFREHAFNERLATYGLKGAVWDLHEQGEPAPPRLTQDTDFLVGRRRADAILASNDIVATRFILQLQRKGLRIPDDVAVIGYDNLDIGRAVSPALTTVDQCHREYASQALDLVEALAAGRPIPAGQRQKVVQPQLIFREST